MNTPTSPELIQLFQQFIDASKNSQDYILKDIIPRLDKLEDIGLDSNQTIHRVENKVDSIIDTLTQLQMDFQELRQSDYSDDEKIMVMSKKLERVETNVEQQEIEEYYSLCQSKYDDYWIEFDELTRKFLPISEILFVKLKTIQDADYTPVVLELCKALENEWISKLFRKYAESLISKKKGNMLEIFLSKDRSKLVKATGKFAKAIINSVNGPFIFTFGQMRTTLQQLSDTDLINDSPLLKDFYDYLNKNININELIKNEYMDQIDELIKNYRNPSAHSEFVSLQMAKDCREIFPERLNYFEKCVV